MSTTTFTNGVTLTDAGWFNDVDLITYDGTTAQILVGGGAGVIAVWTTATGTGSPVRGTSPSFTTGVISASTTLAVFNTVATTVNAFGGASVALNIGHASGTNTILGASTFSQAVTHSSTLTQTGALTYGGVALSNAVTGTGNMVLATAPTFTTSINSDATFTAFAGATTLLTIGGTGASSTVAIPGTLDSTAISNGSLKTAGGAGITKALWVGGLANIAGAVTLQSTLGVTGNVSLGTNMGQFMATVTCTVANTWYGTGASSRHGIYVFRDTTSGGVAIFNIDIGLATATSIQNGIGSFEVQVSGGEAQIRVTAGAAPRVIRLISMFADNA